MRFSDIKAMTRPANYRVDVSWKYLRRWLESNEELGLDLDPDFQRAHVWDDAKRTRYVEFILREGCSSRDIYFNCVGWGANFDGPMVIVDGKQRLNAVLGFLDDKVPAFGYLYSEFSGRLPITTRLSVHVNNLDTRREVLQWYLDLNDGGVAHTSEEIQKVKDLLDQEG